MTTPTTAPPQFSGDPGSPFCTRLHEIDPTTLLSEAPGDPIALERAFRGLVGTLRDLAALAPPEIEGDAVLVAEGMEALDAALAAVDYDYEALAASGAASAISTLANDPAFVDAGERLGAYRAQVCRL